MLCVLEFDHIDPENKVCCVYQCSSIEKMVIEANKCFMLCGKCHMRKTKKQFNYGSSGNPGSTYINQRKVKIGGCEMCGWFDENLLEALQFDHLDPNTKRSNVSRLTLFSIQRIDEEIALCRLLCINCHKLHTLEQNDCYLYKDTTGVEYRAQRATQRIKVI